MSTPPLRLIPLLLALALLIVIPPDIARAQTITLTDPNCTRDGLNAAIQAAPDGATITFSCADPVIEFTEQIVIDKTITIDGGEVITLDAIEGDGIETRFFTVESSGDLTVSSITMQNGSGQDDFDPFTFADSELGGAIFNKEGGNLTIINSLFTQNNAIINGAAIISDGNLAIVSSTFTRNALISGGTTIVSDGTAFITQSIFSLNGDGAIQNDGTMEVTDSFIFLNLSGIVGGGGINNNGDLTVRNSVFAGNVADNGGGGAIRNGFDATMNVTNSKFTGNVDPTTGDGGAGGIVNNNNNMDLNAGSITKSCFAGNGIAVQDTFGTLSDLNENWWGTPDGPAGEFDGSGDAVTSFADTVEVTKYQNFVRIPTFDDFVCPTVFPDFYSASIGETIEVGASEGVLNNDLTVLANSVEIETEPDFGSLSLQTDGSFTYTANEGDSVDGFRYRARDFTNDDYIGLVCITRSSLDIIAPPIEEADVGTPTLIDPPVQVVDTLGTTDKRVRVELTVASGVLNVPGGDVSGSTTISPSEECKDLLDQLRQPEPDGGGSVSNSMPNIDLMSSRGRAGFASYYQPTTIVQGDGTNKLVIEGSLDDVNTLLVDLEYTGATAGVDQLAIVANDDTGGVAVGQVKIIIGGSSTVLVSTTSSDDDEAGAAPAIGVEPLELSVPLGPSTLFEMSQIPQSILRGEASESTIAEGDVFVRIIALNGQLLVSPEQVGDPLLVERGIFSGAEVFGLSFSGASVAQFNASAEICLRGFGTYYYRDASQMPRRTEILSAFVEDGFTCALIPNSGTVLLIVDGTVPEPQIEAESVAGGTLPDGCMVTTDAIINLREGPGTGNEIIRRIPFDVTLTAFEQSGRWYYVDYLGLQGWMSADFVSPNEMC